MKDVTYTGPANYLRTDSGRLIRAGVRSQVTDADADKLTGRPDVTVHRDQANDED